MKNALVVSTNWGSVPQSFRVVSQASSMSENVALQPKAFVAEKLLALGSAQGTQRFAGEN